MDALEEPRYPQTIQGYVDSVRNQLELTYFTLVWCPLAVFYLAAAIFREGRFPMPHRDKH